MAGKRKNAFGQLMEDVSNLEFQPFQLPSYITQDHKRAVKAGMLPYGLTSFGAMPAVRKDGLLPASLHCNVCRYGRLCEVCVAPESTMRIQWYCPCHTRDQTQSKVRVLAPNTRVRLDFGKSHGSLGLEFVEKEVRPDVIVEDAKSSMAKKSEWAYNLSIFQHALKEEASHRPSSSKPVAIEPQKMKELLELQQRLARQSMPGAKPVAPLVAVSDKEKAEGPARNEELGVKMQPIMQQFSAWRQLMHVNQQLRTLQTLGQRASSSDSSEQPTSSIERSEAIAQRIAEQYRDEEQFVAEVGRLGAEFIRPSPTSDDSMENGTETTDHSRSNGYTDKQSDLRLPLVSEESESDDAMETETTVPVLPVRTATSSVQTDFSGALPQPVTIAPPRSLPVTQPQVQGSTLAPSSPAPAPLPVIGVHLKLDGTRKQFSFPNGSVTIGKSSQTGIALRPVDLDLSLLNRPTDTISHQHCSIFHESVSGVFMLMNYGRNGTYVDGQLYTEEPASLDLGSKIQMGSFVFTFNPLRPEQQVL